MSLERILCLDVLNREGGKNVEQEIRDLSWYVLQYTRGIPEHAPLNKLFNP